MRLQRNGSIFPVAQKSPSACPKGAQILARAVALHMHADLHNSQNVPSQSPPRRTEPSQEVIMIARSKDLAEQPYTMEEGCCSAACLKM